MRTANGRAVCTLTLGFLFCLTPVLSASAQEEGTAAPRALVASAAATADTTVGLSFQLVDFSGGQPLTRAIPGHRVAVRLTVHGTPDSASADKRLRRVSVGLIRYGDAESRDARDSTTFAGQGSRIDWKGSAGSTIIDLGTTTPSDSAFIIVTEEGVSYSPIRIWKRPTSVLPPLILYGNLQMPSEADENAIAQAVEPFIQKIPTKTRSYKLTPQTAGDVPGRRPAALGIDFPESSGFGPWVPFIKVKKVIYRGSSTVDTIGVPSPVFTLPSCKAISSMSGQSDSTCASYAFLGRTPLADSVEVIVTFREEARAVRVWTERSSQFLVALTLGTTFPLNKLSPNDTVTRLEPRLGFNGRVVITEMDPAWSKLGRLGLFNNEFFRGPVVAEGDLFLGLSTLQEGVADSNRYEQATEGNLRLSVPILDFGRSVAVRGLYEVGSISIRDSDELQSEHYWGFRLGLDPADISGRQSYIELLWGKSENLSPENRKRLTIQFRVPTTKIVLQFKNNFARGKPQGAEFENTSILSAYVPLDAAEVLRILGLRGVEATPESTPAGD